MKNLFLAVEEAAALISSGAALFVSGPEELLETLPSGRWIGGTTAYFVTEDGGVSRDDRLFCTVFDEALDVRTSIIPADDLKALVTSRFDRGFACIVAPAFSSVHERYAVEGPSLPALFDQPVFGWVAGVPLDRIGQIAPKVYDGATRTAHEDGLATMWVRISETTDVDLDIVNMFVQGDGDTIVFPRTGFGVTDCLVNGTSVNFATYVGTHNIDTRLPLVADHAGAMVNVSFQSVDHVKGDVAFYAPVTAGTEYKLAKPLHDRSGAYDLAAGGKAASAALSCNCILNYLHADLEGGGAGGFVGPVTFGEFAYILLNQTLARVLLIDTAEGAGHGLRAA
ncbi:MULTISPECIES: DUF6976 family protein [unclassified Aureimonas]|uniref:DUF6976 family protein n=1 Tax=unclassified Aureimonas TaxID=2615206 RepID=UPI0006FBED5B|nr:MULTISPECIES: hypothetical protein [unclassified Aureimonas]KQT55197.1 hypothetical protein ASG62_10175 [Aureimonas sp. Leaf427]KQT70987.1 hypothetical protein ASG54_20560 [Aureimonas sp. Leaf460]